MLRFHRGLHMSEITYQVKIADATGHTVAQMTKPEIVAKANASQGTWVFVNDRLVSASELAAMTFADSDQFKVMPGLVGGDDPGNIWGEGVGIDADGVEELVQPLF